MSDEDADDEGLEARLRKIVQMVSQSVEHLEELDLDRLARVTGVDIDRAKALIEGAGQWLNRHADDAVGEGVLRFGGLLGAVSGSPAAAGGAGPHPLDLPSAAQGLALSAIESGRWTVEPGSHVLATDGEGPAPADALGLVGELRARDWINAEGGVTLVGHTALKRWVEHSSAS